MGVQRVERNGCSEAGDAQRQDVVQPQNRQSPRRDQFIPRITKQRAEELTGRVIRNAEVANADPNCEFTFERVGVFGSAMTDQAVVGDINVMFVARWRDDDKIIPESSYHPFGGDEPNQRASKVFLNGLLDCTYPPR